MVTRSMPCRWRYCPRMFGLEGWELALTYRLLKCTAPFTSCGVRDLLDCMHSCEPSLGRRVARRSLIELQPKLKPINTCGSKWFVEFLRPYSQIRGLNAAKEVT